MEMKGNRLPLIILLPIIGGIALLGTGIATGRNDLLMAGVGVLFGGSFLMALVISIYTIVSATRNTAAREERMNSVMSEIRERVAEKSEDKEQAAKVRANLEKIEAGVRKRRRKEKVTKFLSVLFVVTFIACLIVGMSLLASGYMLAGGIVFACGPAMIIFSLVGVKLKEHFSLSGNSKNLERKVGRVANCMFSSGSGSKTVYRIEVEVEDKTYTAYSTETYERGEKVEVSVGGGKFTHIIGRAVYGYGRGTENPVPASDDPFETYEHRRAAKSNNNDACIHNDTAEESEPQGVAIGSIFADKERRDAIADKALKLHAAMEIEDEDERRAARKIARDELLGELNRLKEIREKVGGDNKEPDRAVEMLKAMSTGSAKKEPAYEPSATTEAARNNLLDELKKVKDIREKASTETIAEPEKHDEDIHETHTASPSCKRTTIAYKGIKKK